jgi:hypothetical protein
MWCDMPEARGEKMVRLVPRSRWNLSWAPSTLARSSSSLIRSAAADGLFAGSLIAAIWPLRKSWSFCGSVV